MSITSSSQGLGNRKLSSGQILGNKTLEYVTFPQPWIKISIANAVQTSIRNTMDRRAADTSGVVCSTACITGLCLGIGLGLLFGFLLIYRTNRQIPNTISEAPTFSLSADIVTDPQKRLPESAKQFDDPPAWLRRESIGGPATRETIGGSRTQTPLPIPVPLTPQSQPAALPSRPVSPWQPGPVSSLSQTQTPADPSTQVVDEGRKATEQPGSTRERARGTGASAVAERISKVETAVRATMEAARAEEARARAERRDEDAAQWGSRLAKLQVRGTCTHKSGREGHGARESKERERTEGRCAWTE